MADRLNIRKDHPDSWIAVQEGDVLVGRVKDVTEAWSEQRNNGSWYPLLTIGSIEQATGYEFTDSTELKVHAFGSVLYNEVMRHQPEIGERIQIIYKGTGEVRVRGQNPPELYALRVAGRRDQAQRAYARIEGGARGPSGQESHQQRPEAGSQTRSRPPIEQEDMDRTTIQTPSGEDEDIPF